MKRIALIIALGATCSFNANAQLTAVGNAQQVKTCFTNSSGIVTNPEWRNGPNKLFSACTEVNVGIGKSDPNYRLDVKGQTAISSNVGIGVVPSGQVQLNTKTYRKVGLCIDHNYPNDYGYVFKGILQREGTKGIGLYNSAYNKDIFTVYGNGKMTIANDSRTILQLESNGLLRMRHAKVDQDSWADYVFEEDYQLMDLKEVEAFVTTNKHLPEVPSEAEITAEGVNIAEMNVLLIKKIEELTLYTIQQQKDIEALRQEVKSLSQD